MALITCPECKHSVSDQAPACPSCGYPIKPVPARGKKTGLWWGLGCLLAVPAVLMIIAVVGMLAAIAIPSFVKARSNAQAHACSSNLKQIDAAKNVVVLEHNLREGVNVPEPDLSKFLKNGLDGLVCPGQGQYKINPVGQDPACTVHGKLSEIDPDKVTPAKHPENTEKIQP